MGFVAVLTLLDYLGALIAVEQLFKEVCVSVSHSWVDQRGSLEMCIDDSHVLSGFGLFLVKMRK